jgi:hypothetical protein
MNRQPSPLDKLQAERANLRRQCLLREQRLGDLFAYMGEHSGRLLLSGLSGLLFPDAGSAAGAGKANSASGWAVCRSAGKAALPLLWNIARPVLLAWGVSKLQSLLSRRLRS